MKEINLIWIDAYESDLFPNLLSSRCSNIMNLRSMGELNITVEAFEKTRLMTIKNKKFQSTYSYIEEFDNTDYLDTTGTNASGWGRGSIRLHLGGNQPIYVNTSAHALEICVSKGYAFVAAESSGLAIINISDPTTPSQPIYMDTNGSAQGVFVNGDYAFIADGLSGLAIIDINDPMTPSQPIYKNLSDTTRDVCVSGNYAFVTIGEPIMIFPNALELLNSKLVIIDISTPLTPGDPIYREINGSVQDIYVSGDYAFIACGFKGLAIIDISNPTAPGQPVYIDTRRPARGVYVIDDYAYVSMDDPFLFDDNYTEALFGLAIIDISDPTVPSQPIYQNTSTDAWGVHVSGDHAFIASGGAGLAFLDISNPLAPSSPIYRDTEGFAENVCVSGNFAFVADGEGGLAIIEVERASRSMVQSTSFYTSKGFVHNVTLNANQTLFPNTSINYQISSDGNTWIPLTLNESYFFATNPYHDLYWRAVLEAEDSQDPSPYIDSIRIDFDVYYDEDPPIILLITPQNNTIISPGAVVELMVTDIEYSLNDDTLDHCWFNWDEGINLPLNDPWTILVPTTEGYHWLAVYANDSVGHLTVKKLSFIINFYPRIEVISPLNGTFVTTRDTTIHVNFTDGIGLHWIWYNWDDQSNITIDNLDYGGSLVYSLYLGGLPESEGVHSLNFYANDTYGRINSTFLQFYMDMIPPSINLTSHQNNTAILPGTSLEFSINDYSLDNCWFNWDNGSDLTLTEHWNIIAPISEGYHWLVINANDSVGHLTTARYYFYVTYPPHTTSLSTIHSSNSSSSSSTPFDLRPLLQILGPVVILFFVATVVIIIRRQQLG